MKILIYTFRTFPHKEEIEKFFDKVFIFSQLNDDFEKFSELIFKSQPDLILGVAKSNKQYSQWESLAINQFNKTKKILKDGPDKFDLFVPNLGLNIETSTKPSDSFCNWTMYKISHFLQENKLETKLAFIHAGPKLIKLLRYKYSKKQD